MVLIIKRINQGYPRTARGQHRPGCWCPWPVIAWVRLYVGIYFERWLTVQRNGTAPPSGLILR